MKKRLPKSKLIEIIDHDLAALLPIEESHPVETVNPLDFISPERFDIMADYIYAKFHHLNTAQNWARKVYAACKRLVVTPIKNPAATEVDVSDQRTIDELLDRVDTDGIDPQDNYLPVSMDGVLIGNAHQLGASLVYDSPVQAIKFNYQPQVYDYRFLLENGLSRDIGDFMALTFCRLCQNLRVVVVFPIARGKDHAVEAVLSEYGRIAYEKQVAFTELGRYNLIQILYFNMHWIDPNGDITYGVRHHVDHRFWKDDSVKFYFFVFDDTSKILEAKTRLRTLFDLKNFPVHINDTHDETIWVSEHILTPNSIYFMNHAQPWLCKHFLKRLRAFHLAIDQQGLDKDNFCLVGSGMIAAYGLRDTRHLEFIYFDDASQLRFSSEFHSVNTEIASEMKPIGDLIFDPRNYYYFRGMKFISPSTYREVLLKQHSTNIQKDARLMDSIEGESFDGFRFWRNLRFLLKKTFVQVTHIELERFRILVPKFLRPIAKKLYERVSNQSRNKDA